MLLTKWGFFGNTEQIKTIRQRALPHLFQKALDFCCCDRVHHGPICSFHLLWIQIATEPSTLFYRSFMIICVVLWCFSDVDDPTGTEHISKPAHVKINKMASQWRLRSTWASVQYDQSLLWAQYVANDLGFLHAHSEDSDQTGRMPSLIWVFAGHTCHFVGFFVR